MWYLIVSIPNCLHSYLLLILKILFLTLEIVTTCYKPAGHIVTEDLKIITDSRIRSHIGKGPKYRFHLPLDLKSYREKITGALQYFCSHLCK